MKKFFIKLIKGISVGNVTLDDQLQWGNWRSVIWILRFFRWFSILITAVGLSSFLHLINTGDLPKWLQWFFSFLKNPSSENIWTFLVVACIVSFFVGYAIGGSLFIFLPKVFEKIFPTVKVNWDFWIEFSPNIFIVLWLIFYYFIPDNYLGWFLLVSGTIGGIVSFVRTLSIEKRFVQSFPGRKIPKGIIERDDEYIQWKLSKGETIIRRRSDGFVSDLNILWEARERAAYYENDDERLHEIRSRKMMENLQGALAKMEATLVEKMAEKEKVSQKTLEKILRELKELKAPKTPKTPKAPKAPRKKSSPGKRGGKS